MVYYKIDEQTLQSIVNYLAQRPYNEVAQGIEALKSLEVIDDKQE